LLFFFPFLTRVKSFIKTTDTRVHFFFWNLPDIGYEGVSNYGVHHLKELLEDSNATIRPAVNQIEVHPWLARTDLVSFCHSHNIAVESYSPLVQGQKLQDPTLAKIASAHSKSPAQVLIRWNLQKGNIVIPKSSKKHRIIENADVFGFELSEDEVETLAALNENFVTGRPFFCCCCWWWWCCFLVLAVFRFVPGERKTQFHISLFFFFVNQIIHTFLL
jgi:hypothetical protein